VVSSRRDFIAEKGGIVEGSTDRQKGQSSPEYALLIILIAGVIFIFYLLFGSWVCQKTTEFGVPVCLNSTDAANPGNSPISKFMPLFITLMPIGLPVSLAILTCLYDGTVKIKKALIDLKPGQFPASLCLSGITFDTWGLVTVLQNQSLSSITKSNIGILMLFFFLIHMGSHYLCLKIMPGHQWRFLQLFLVFISVMSPVCLLLPTNIFLVSI
jgi:hypothetical protein